MVRSGGLGWPLCGLLGGAGWMSGVLCVKLAEACSEVLGVVQALAWRARSGSACAVWSCVRAVVDDVE